MPGPERKGETVVRNLHQKIFVIHYFSRSAQGEEIKENVMVGTRRQTNHTKNVVDNPADTGKLGALSVSCRKIGDNIKIYM